MGALDVQVNVRSLHVYLYGSIRRKHLCIIAYGERLGVKVRYFRIENDGVVEAEGVILFKARET